MDPILYRDERHASLNLPWFPPPEKQSPDRLAHRSTSSSFGWHPTHKKAEMFHHDARFLIASHVENHHSPDSPVAGFAIFRFKVEPNMEDEDEPVAYLLVVLIDPSGEPAEKGSFDLNLSLCS
jgi:hypothetical protein